METKELMAAYRVISKVMQENNKKYDTSFRAVKNWLANKICDQLDDGQIIETLETLNKV